MKEVITMRLTEETEIEDTEEFNKKIKAGYLVEGFVPQEKTILLILSRDHKGGLYE